MTIQVELSPEAEANLAAQAVLHGVALEQYAGRLLEEVLTPQPARAGVLTSPAFHDLLRELAEGSERLPQLPTSAFSRESIYDEHA